MIVGCLDFLTARRSDLDHIATRAELRYFEKSFPFHSMRRAINRQDFERVVLKSFVKFADGNGSNLAVQSRPNFRRRSQAGHRVEIVNQRLHRLKRIAFRLFRRDLNRFGSKFLQRGLVGKLAFEESAEVF